MKIKKLTQSMQITPEENQILMQIRGRLLQVAPEIGDIMQNQRSKAILYSILDVLGQINPSQLKTILTKAPQAPQAPQEQQAKQPAPLPTQPVPSTPDQGVIQQTDQTMVPPSG